MSSVPRSVHSAASGPLGDTENVSAAAANAQHQQFGEAENGYRMSGQESLVANTAGRAENGRPGDYPSPVGTLAAFHYDGGMDGMQVMMHSEMASMQPCLANSGKLSHNNYACS